MIEFNVRFGDPEAQVVLPLVASGLLPLLLAAAEGRLRPSRSSLARRGSVGVVLASRGYPGPVRSGTPSPASTTAGAAGGVTVFHAGTALRDGELVTAGGRVLTVVGTGPDYQVAIARAYDGGLDASPSTACSTVTTSVPKAD